MQYKSKSWLVLYTQTRLCAPVYGLTRLERVVVHASWAQLGCKGKAGQAGTLLWGLRQEQWGKQHGAKILNYCYNPDLPKNL